MILSPRLIHGLIIRILKEEYTLFLELTYYGQNDGTTVPEIVMTGDPGVDNAALTANGYLSGRIMSIVSGNTSAPNTPVATAATGLVIHPCDGASDAA